MPVVIIVILVIILAAVLVKALDRPPQADVRDKGDPKSPHYDPNSDQAKAYQRWLESPAGMLYRAASGVADERISLPGGIGVGPGGSDAPPVVPVPIPAPNRRVMVADGAGTHRSPGITLAVMFLAIVLLYLLFTDPKQQSAQPL